MLSLVKTLIVILGPTGVGKTETCLRVAEYFHIPIINADSRQIFKGLPIGTAAPTETQQQRVRHYMVGHLDIEAYYNASMFENDVIELLPHLFQTSDIALLSGGSMMYIDAVCQGMGDLPTVPDDLRMLMKRRLQEEGLPALCDELQRLDPGRERHLPPYEPAKKSCARFALSRLVSTVHETCSTTVLTIVSTS